MKFKLSKSDALHYLWILASFIPLCAACYSTTQPSLQALAASHALESLAEDEAFSSLPRTAGKRKIQRHYLDYGIYIPIDDIILDLEGGTNIAQLKMLRKACGAGQTFVWIPLRFRFPMLGEKVFEWCLTMK
ncbi:hypothetical protein [Pseudobacteriovorax antillogorgiicola]|nr:hypothetical protein [Pseudobacteriovorax antillogorgiicola]